MSSSPKRNGAKAGRHKRIRSTGSIPMNFSNNNFNNNSNSGFSVSAIFRNAVKPPSHYRRARIVKKAGAVVQKYVRGIKAKSPYLNSCEKQRRQNSVTTTTTTCTTTTSTCTVSDELPLLERTEIQVGKHILGEGGFCQVLEVTGIRLNPLNDHALSLNQQLAREALANSLNTRTTATTTTTTTTAAASTDGEKVDNNKAPVPKYALKQVKKRLTQNPPEFTLAVADLVIEAQYLSHLSHPNILSARCLTLHGTDAMVTSGRYDSYFLLVDRLDDTLDKRIQSWVRGKSEAPSYETKLRYCYEIALALQYLHQRRIVFRDVKPHNIGFTAAPEDKLKLFDFGLCRELPAPSRARRKEKKTTNDNLRDSCDVDVDDDDDERSEAKEEDEYYMMTTVGTRRYMAIEMFISGRYNCKADCYGWAMTCYELLSLCKPFASLNDEDHQEYVCIQGKRPNSKPLLQQCDTSKGKHPPILKVIRAAWEHYVGKRIDSTTLVKCLEQILTDRKRKGSNAGRDNEDDGDKNSEDRIKITEISATEGDSYSSPSDSNDDEQLQEDEPDDHEEEDDRSIRSLLVDKVVSLSLANSRHSTITADGSTASLRWDDSSLNTMELPGSSAGSLNTANFEEYLKERHGATSLGSNTAATNYDSSTLSGPAFSSLQSSSSSKFNKPGLPDPAAMSRITSLDIGKGGGGGGVGDVDEEEDLRKRISGKAKF